MRLTGLNKAQEEAVAIKDGPALVLAGAGTGKTRVITFRIAHLIDQGVRPGHILAVTFTNKAAREMKARAMGLLGRKKKKETPTISTFHSLGVRILREEAAQAGRRASFSIYDRADSVGLVREVLREIVTPDKVPDAELLQVMVSKHKSGGGSSDEEGEAFFSRLVSLYEKALAVQNAFDFDDLIGWPVKLLRDKAVQKKYHDRYRYILVDEYQDTNQRQYELLHHLVGPGRNLFVVGDDDQSIYRFRGAQREKILCFRKDYPGAATIKLEENYRSTNAILKAANAVIQRSANRHDKTLFSRLGEGANVRHLEYGDDQAESDGIVDEIRDAKMLDKKRMEDIAILVRSIFQARPFEEKFRLRDIPYTLVGGRSWFDRKEIKDLVAYMSLLVNENDDTAFLRVANFPRRGVGRKSLEALTSLAKQRKTCLSRVLDDMDSVTAMPQAARNALQALGDHFRQARRRVKGGRAADGVWAFFKQIGFQDAVRTLYPDPDTAEMRVRGVDAFLQSMTRFLKANPGEGLGEFISRFTMDNELDRQDDGEKRKGVTIMTLHSAKGLEFDTVYIPGVEEGIIPHEKSVEEGDDAVDEERRLFYVGMTRAKRYLTLTYCNSRRRRGEEADVKVSRFFSDIPEDLLETGDPFALDRPMSPDESLAYFKMLRQKQAR